MCEILMEISYPRNTTPNQSRSQRWMETLKREQIPPAIIEGTSLTGMRICHFIDFHFELSSNLSDARKRKKSISVINLAVGDKFPSFSLRRKSTSFLNLSGKGNNDDNDDSSNESEEENISLPRTPPVPPVRTSSLEESVRTSSLQRPPKPPRKLQIPIPTPRKISTVSLPVRLARFGFRLCKFAYTFLLHHLTFLLFADPLSDQSFILPGGPQ